MNPGHELSDKIGKSASRERWAIAKASIKKKSSKSMVNCVREDNFSINFRFPNTVRRGKCAPCQAAVLSSVKEARRGDAPAGTRNARKRVIEPSTSAWSSPVVNDTEEQ